jgi:hypothetical protein
MSSYCRAVNVTSTSTLLLHSVQSLELTQISALSPNRNSMPITGYGRKRNTADLSSVGQINPTSFLLDEDEDRRIRQAASATTSPPTAKTYLQVQQTADGFPKLIRREDNVDLSSSALDLALAQGVDPQQQLTDRATARGHRISLPPSALSSNFGIPPLTSILANVEGKSTANNRRSMEVKFSAETKRPSLMASPPRGAANGFMQKPSSSYSTNDIPTLKSINGDSSSVSAASITSPPRQSAAPTDSASDNAISRVTSVASSTNNRRSQDLASALSVTRSEENSDQYSSISSGLQANAQPFGPMGGHHDSPMQNGVGQNGISPYAQAPFYNGYNMQMLNSGFNNMSLNGYNGHPPPQPWQGQMSMYGQQAGYNNYQSYGQNNAMGGGGRYNDNQRAAVQQRRQAAEDAQARFNSVNITQLAGEIYGLCKDQHGCRFLQRKLDERAENAVPMIFEEVKEHIIELMTDPFGNYLCQKLLECTEDDQRTVLIQNASPAMTKIALNQHGTRALQKMIEYISTPEQTEIIIQALRFDVVQLIQDLNGNHVIQKCLNHLTPENAQFIFDAVGANCIIVGTHRHGCCVLQRCIDHASGLQKGALVDQVINNAFHLVQDPFGNYVVQYILDLGEPAFTEPLCRSFTGHIAHLSKQKFSSNVVEKCIRCASNDTRRDLVQEIIVPVELDKLLRDSFANYVVQTAMDFADDQTKNLLVENIRPILPAIRHTPYGRRIQTKIGEYDTRVAATTAAVTSAAASNANSNAPSGTQTPADSLSPPNMNGGSNGTSPYGAHAMASGGRANRNGWAGPPPQWGGLTNGVSSYGPSSFANGFNGNGINGDVASPTPQRNSQGNSIFAGEAPGFGNVGGFNRF